MTIGRSTELGWGPLNTAIHDEDQAPGSPPWKDNAFVAFWDPAQDVYGSVHFSTSPNAEGRRARVNFYAGGPNIEIIEPLQRGTFTSASIRFDLAGIAVVDHPRIQGEFRFQPTTAYADFSAKALPTLNGQPLQHYQIAVSAIGDVVLDGRRIVHGGNGVRDRTWGYREMTLNMPEYIWFFAAFPDYAVTALRFKDINGADRSDGYILDEQARRVVADIAVTRDPCGLCSFGELTLADGSSMILRSGGRRTGFWVPMEWERRGPMMSAYEEFCPLSNDAGSDGFGLVEHGQIRHLY